MYKLERKMTNGVWYEVMLSPFKTREEIKHYYEKYSKSYPIEERIYRLTNLETGGKKLIK
jgi:hypothetical protein